MQASIYFLQFLKDDASTVGGGGIGTEISYLCPVLEEMGFLVTVYQTAGKYFRTTFGNSKVVGIPIQPTPGRPNEKIVSMFRKMAEQETGTIDRLEIFPGDFFSVRNNNPLAITVQQGLAWDAPIELLTPKKIHYTYFGEKLFRFRCQLRGLRRFETCYNRVVVDLYFLNWYRTLRGPNFKGRVWYNPNPAPERVWDSTRDQRINNSEPIEIIFARRMVPEKGTRLAIKVIKELFNLRPNVKVTFAGEGPEENLLHKSFDKEPRVKFVRYESKNSLEIHAKFDITLVPSLCGEGMSLSIVEAMSAGCAVVATNLGGNITVIIDGFNGVLCWPTKESVLGGLLRVIDNPEERLQMQKRGWETVHSSFGLELWQKRWKAIIQGVIEGKEEAKRMMKG